MTIVYLIIAVLAMTVGFKLLKKGLKLLFWICILGGTVFIASALGYIPAIFG
jgi:hypothetical protein